MLNIACENDNIASHVKYFASNKFKEAHVVFGPFKCEICFTNENTNFTFATVTFVPKNRSCSVRHSDSMKTHNINVIVIMLWLYYLHLLSTTNLWVTFSWSQGISCSTRILTVINNLRARTCSLIPFPKVNLYPTFTHSLTPEQKPSHTLIQTLSSAAPVFWTIVNIQLVSKRTVCPSQQSWTDAVHFCVFIARNWWCFRSLTQPLIRWSADAWCLN